MRSGLCCASAPERKAPHNVIVATSSSMILAFRRFIGIRCLVHSAAMSSRWVKKARTEASLETTRAITVYKSHIGRTEHESKTDLSHWLALQRSGARGQVLHRSDGHEVHQGRLRHRERWTLQRKIRHVSQHRASVPGRRNVS